MSSKYDSRQRGRFSHVGAAPRADKPLGYVPVVKSNVVDQDEWRDMKRSDFDPPTSDQWEELPPSEDDALPLPDLDAAAPEQEFPLPERQTPDSTWDERPSDAGAELPVPADLGMSLAEPTDADLPVPQFGATIGDEDFGENEARPGLVPPSPLAAPVVSQLSAPSAKPLTASPELGSLAPPPVFDDVPAPDALSDPFAAPARARASPLPVKPSQPQRSPLPAGPGTSRFSAVPAGPGTARMSAPPQGAQAVAVASPAARFSAVPVAAAAEPAFVVSRAASMPANDTLEADLSPPAASSQPAAAPVPTGTPAFGFSATGLARTPAMSATPHPGVATPEAPGAQPAPFTPARPAPARPPPPPIPGARPSLAQSDEQRLTHARSLAEAGRGEEALPVLEALLAQQPDHELARMLLLELCFRLPRASKVLDHAEWVTVRCLQTQRYAQACDLYRRLRSTFHELALSERLLVAAVENADRADDAQVVLDAAKLIVHMHPQSAYVTRLLFKAADRQLLAGRADLARATYDYVASNYAHDPLAAIARQKLAELAG